MDKKTYSVTLDPAAGPRTYTAASPSGAILKALAEWAGEKKTCDMCPESALQPVSPYESLGMLVTHKCEICGEKWSKP